MPAGFWYYDGTKGSVSPFEAVERRLKAMLPASEVVWRQQAPGLAQWRREVEATIGGGVVHGLEVAPPLELRRWMRSALGECTAWGPSVADSILASSQVLPFHIVAVYGIRARRVFGSRRSARTDRGVRFASACRGA